MKNTIELLFGLLLFMFAACKKDAYDKSTNDKSGKTYIYGRVFIADSINDNGLEKPFTAKMKIKLAYQAEPQRILDEAETDENGYFIFTGLKENTSYLLTGSASVQNVLFSIRQTQDIGNEPFVNPTPLLLIDTVDQNGVLFIVKNNSTNDLISDCTGYLFKDRYDWQNAIYGNKTFDMNTNKYGIAFKSNLLPGTYYATFIKNAGNKTFRDSLQVIIPTKGISRYIDVNLK